jgi:hypothetical protein
LDESSSHFNLLFKHDLIGKPHHTFPDHALGCSKAEQRQTDPAEGEQAASDNRDRSKRCNCFCERHDRTFCMTVTLCSTMSAQKWQEDARSKLRAVVAVLQHDPDLARKNP